MATTDTLIGLDRAALSARLADMGVPERSLRMRVNQLWSWLYQRGVSDFDEMTNISKDLRSDLAQHFAIGRPEITSEQVSQDGTRKWLMNFGPGIEVETVFIPDDDRGTLCVSSQVGCTLNCSFCHTGTQNLVRNLTANEVLSQILVAKDALGEWDFGVGASEDKRPRKLTNIVMMGMGEPLYNFDNVRDALLIASDTDAAPISKRRITLSTSGVVPEMPRIANEIGVMLAISLHAVRDDLRDELVPINKKYPIKDLMDACRNFPGATNAKRITFEYVMLKGINDSIADAKELVRLLKHIPSKINLIPFNPWPGSPFECSDWEQIEKFSDVVYNAGYASPIRTPRGRDIMAACGQLKSESIKQRASQARVHLTI